MKEKIVRINGIHICTESVGDPTNPAILLMMGATASMVWWDSDFCKKLAAAGFFVIRYDNRDTGRSITNPPGPPPYTVEDMADDAIAILDDYGIASASLFGISLGGFIAQLVALKYPERVTSLVLMMSEPLGPGNPDLPPIDEQVIAHHMKGAAIDWTDKEAVIDFMTDGWRLLSGTKRVFEEERTRKLATQEVNRATNLISSFNHAQLTGGEAYFNRLQDIKAPTLIIHGTEDKVLPYGYALELFDKIPNARLLTLDGVGHELHTQDWDTVITAIEELNL